MSMPVDWLPSPADVAAFIRARTKTVAGREGDFTDETRPTFDQVIELIDVSVSEVDAKLKAVPEFLQPRARRVTALGAACLAELTFWPEQVATGRSPYDHLNKLYQSQLKDLITDANNASEDGTEPGGSTASPAYGFPDQCGFIGLDTRW